MRAIDASKKGRLTMGYGASNPLISPENLCPHDGGGSGSAKSSRQRWRKIESRPSFQCFRSEAWRVV
jgi:hypothetical protein